MATPACIDARERVHGRKLGAAVWRGIGRSLQIVETRLFLLEIDIVFAAFDVEAAHGIRHRSAEMRREFVWRRPGKSFFPSAYSTAIRRDLSERIRRFRQGTKHISLAASVHLCT
jgi:hypothetical protein